MVGLLKTGSKTLFMFDENGLHYQIKPRCILDFYIHESKQRMGLGNQLYEHMLAVNICFVMFFLARFMARFFMFLHYTEFISGGEPETYQVGNRSPVG